MLIYTPAGPKYIWDEFPERSTEQLAGNAIRVTCNQGRDTLEWGLLNRLAFRLCLVPNPMHYDSRARPSGHFFQATLDALLHAM